MARRALRTTLGLTAATLGWIVAVASGMAMLAAYASTPGTPASAPPIWPTASAIVRRAGMPTILVFAHPGCPCTRATLGEIDWLLARVDGRVDVHVLVLQPESADRAWADTSLEQLAESIPRVQVQRDVDGREATRFGVATSGQVLLYDAADRLRFAGGITGARGHAGGNAGRDRLLMQVTEASADDPTSSPVFGCGLWSPPAT